jgi:hypothetical protein
MSQTAKDLTSTENMSVIMEILETVEVREFTSYEALATEDDFSSFSVTWCRKQSQFPKRSSQKTVTIEKNPKEWS